MNNDTYKRGCTYKLELTDGVWLSSIIIYMYIQYSTAGKLPTYISIVVSCIYKAIPHLLVLHHSLSWNIFA